MIGILAWPVGGERGEARGEKKRKVSQRDSLLMYVFLFFWICKNMVSNFGFENISVNFSDFGFRLRQMTEITS
jgi:hypothetical protein